MAQWLSARLLKNHRGAGEEQLAGPTLEILSRQVWAGPRNLHLTAPTPLTGLEMTQGSHEENH